MTEVKQKLIELFKQISKFEIEKVKIYENIIKLADTQIADDIILKTAQETFKNDVVNTHDFNINVMQALGIKFEEEEEDEEKEEVDDIEIKKAEANKEYEEKKEKLKQEVKKEEEKQLNEKIKEEDEDSESIAKRLGLD